VRRRRFLLGTTALAAARLTPARVPDKKRTLGILSFGIPRTSTEIASTPFGEKLAALGWVHGRNLRFEPAYAAGRLERLPELAAGLVRKSVDAIWVVSPPAAVAAARATRTIPIVFVRVVWPVELGLAESFARPGGNVTGVASIADPEILAKPSEYLREVVPGLKRLTTIAPGAAIYQTVSGGKFTPTLDLRLLAIMDSLGIAIRRHLVATARDIDAALADALETRADGLFVSSSPLIFAQAKRIADFALQHRLPSAFIETHFVEAGGLLSYGSSVWGTIFQSLDYVDAILRGAQPAELPIQLPTQMELAINLLTARGLGLAVPESLLLRADRIVGGE
jgi:putative tryptophan/tyrosine transport system substrate-binding protein